MQSRSSSFVIVAAAASFILLLFYCRKVKFDFLNDAKRYKKIPIQQKKKKKTNWNNKLSNGQTTRKNPNISFGLCLH